MARAQLALGTHGKINARGTTPCKKGVHANRCPNANSKDTSACKVYPSARARCWYRKFDGEYIHIDKMAPTVTAAEEKVKAEIRLLSAGIDAPKTAHAVTVEALVLEVIQKRLDRNQIGRRTAETYRKIVNSTVSLHFGNLTPNAVNDELAETLMAKIMKKTPGNYASAKTVLIEAFDLAKSRRIIATNPISNVVRFISYPKGWKSTAKQRGARPVSPAEIELIRDYLKSRPRKSSYLLNVIDVIVGTSWRISEVLALTLDDLRDLDDPTDPVLYSTGHLVEDEEYRMERLQGSKSYLGAFVVENPTEGTKEALRRQQRASYATKPSDLIFTTEGRGKYKGTRTPIYPANVRNGLNAVQKALGLEPGISPHSFRKSVSEFIEGKLGDEGKTVSTVLNNSPSVARKHYLPKPTRRSPDMTALLEGFIKPDTHERKMSAS